MEIYAIEGDSEERLQWGDQPIFVDLEPQDGLDDKVRVKVSRPSNSFIADAFGVGSPTLNPSAAAAKIRAFGACVLPWAIDAHPDYEDTGSYANVWGVLGPDVDPTNLFVFQLSPGGGFAGDDSAPGNFGALGIYGANDRDYTDTIINECGSQGESACDSDSQVLVPDTTLDCDIQTGNLGNTTNKALTERAIRFGEAGPDYTDCDADSYSDAVIKADSCQGRLVVLAIIKDFPASGSDTIEVYGIANFYIAGWDRCPPPSTTATASAPSPMRVSSGVTCCCRSWAAPRPGSSTSLKRPTTPSRR